jgi:hypothetical protein
MLARTRLPPVSAPILEMKKLRDISPSAFRDTRIGIFAGVPSVNRVKPFVVRMPFLLA